MENVCNVSSRGGGADQRPLACHISPAPFVKVVTVHSPVAVVRSARLSVLWRCRGAEVESHLRVPTRLRWLERVLRAESFQQQSYGVYAGVKEGQAEAHDPEVVPEGVVVGFGVGGEVEPQEEHVVGKEADEEDNDESENCLGDFLPRPYLPRLWGMKLPGHVMSAENEVAGHHHVEEAYDAQRDPVFVRERVADDQSGVVETDALDVRSERGREGKDDRESPDGRGYHHGDSGRPAAADGRELFSDRVDDGEEPVCRQRDVFGGLGELAYEFAEGPVGHGVDRGGEGYTADYDQQVSESQAEDVGVGDVPHGAMTDEDDHQGTVAHHPHQEDEGEQDRHVVSLRSVRIGRDLSAGLVGHLCYTCDVYQFLINCDVEHFITMVRPR
ncbi:hypothetical protein J6590_077920 [Homalodisca vitripennis]|nr:hypothetical protein J6590_077920 [Homalodisca vitripennis]